MFSNEDIALLNFSEEFWKHLNLPHGTFMCCFEKKKKKKREEKIDE